ncbi:FtsQ-type POTRA domain-containing protein [Paenibacillus sp. SYP-B3998]|uniref:FtsQ-type POTRA domain-containing protein n=1 Tax=Paenibacillus sp. SYP-B3998 TaxID=2678564 RepID=A0A6G3ZTB0_9BACL|nr:FtsQ-type POTRA domain-containing protein [Paenibacillus sp. SYP-B3998]NEW05278.1 FtsQ-type POTRA domain-containing protein [Paenibacillus sp. SYP-B3998]
MTDDRKVPALPSPKPRARTNRKLLGFLFVFFITVLVILFFQSSLSRISTIQIEGNELLSSEAIGQASLVTVGERFFAVNSSTIEQRVAKLPVVKMAKVTKHFPGVINIAVVEYPKVAIQIGAEGKKEAVLADGAVIAFPTGSIPLDMPILTGWSDGDPNKAALCKVLGEIPASSLSDISEIKPDPSDSYPDKIKLYTRSQFEVYTTIAYLAEKIDNLPAYIASLQEDHITDGIIKMLEVDNHAPFDPNVEPKSESNSQTNQKALKSPSPSPNPNKETGKSGGKSTPKPTPKPTPKEMPKETVRPS